MGFVNIYICRPMSEFAHLHVVHLEPGPQTKLGAGHHGLPGTAEEQQVGEEEEISLLVVACPC